MPGKRTFGIAAACLIGLAACTGGGGGSHESSSPPQPPGSSSPPAAPHPVVSVDQARKVFEAFEQKRNAANAHLKVKTLNGIETAGARTIDAAQYDQIGIRHRVAGGPAQYGSPVHTSGVRIDVPSQGGYPADFLVQGTANGRTQYTVFTKDSASGPWLVSYLATLAKGEHAPALAIHDGFGSKVEVASAGGLAESPASLAASFAAYLQSLGSSGGGFAPGPNTTQTVAAIKRSIAANKAKHVSSTVEEAASPFPALAFRTADGGALVFFAFLQNATIKFEGSGFLVQDAKLTHYSPYILPGNYSEITENKLFLAAAADPPAGSKVDVAGEYGGITYATGART